MERIIFIVLSLFLFCTLCPNTISAETSTVAQNQIIKNPEPSECIKTFSIAFDKLFYLTLAGVNEYNYKIKEIQSKSGYIIFETGYRKYLASVVYVSANKSMLKITPYSGNYDFPIVVVQNMFNYIEQYSDKSF